MKQPSGPRNQRQSKDRSSEECPKFGKLLEHLRISKVLNRTSILPSSKVAEVSPLHLNNDSTPRKPSNKNLKEGIISNKK